MQCFSINYNDLCFYEMEYNNFEEVTKYLENNKSSIYESEGVYYCNNKFSSTSFHLQLFKIRTIIT